ncbi:unnamed protein product [Caenorhabditis brenneri]
MMKVPIVKKMNNVEKDTEKAMTKLRNAQDRINEHVSSILKAKDDKLKDLAAQHEALKEKCRLDECRNTANITALQNEMHALKTSFARKINELTEKARPLQQERNDYKDQVDNLTEQNKKLVESNAAKELELRNFKKMSEEKDAQQAKLEKSLKETKDELAFKDVLMNSLKHRIAFLEGTLSL